MLCGAFLRASLALLPPTPVRRTVTFPRHALLGADGKMAARPGVQIEMPPFDAGGTRWQVSIYPRGVGESYANRVGVYLKLVGAPGREVDATFSLSLRTLGSADAEAAPSRERLGLQFRCGMTFCEAGEALESAGRCVDWGAHVCPTALLLARYDA